MKLISLKLCNNGTNLWLTDKNYKLWNNIDGKIIYYNYISSNQYNKNDIPVYSENNNIYWISYNCKKNLVYNNNYHNKKIDKLFVYHVY